MKLLDNINPFKQKPEKKKELKGKRDPKLYPSSGYTYTPSYIKANKNYGTVVKLNNHFGKNRNQSYGWFVNIVPKINVEGVKGYFIEVSKPLKQNEQRKVMTTASKTEKLLDQEEGDSDKGKERLKDMHMMDIAQANVYHSEQELAIDCKRHLLLCSKNPDEIAEQLKALNDLYREEYAGIKLESDPGDQENLFKNMLLPPKGTIYEDMMLASDYVGFDHAIRRGINDEKGVPIGELTASLTEGVAMMDLNGSFKDKILVSGTKNSYIYQYDPKLSAASMWGQKIAHHAMQHGHRTYHIVLNDFDFYGQANIPGVKKTFSAEPIVNQVLEKIDLSKGGLNPLQVFGDENDQVRMFTHHLDKLVYQFYLYTNRNLNTSMTIRLKKEIESFYESRGMWDSLAHKYPGRLRIIGKDPKSYPLFDQLLLTLTNYEGKTRDKTAKKQEEAEEMVTALESVLTTNYQTINSYTNLPETDKPDKYQYYYQLGGLDGNLKEAQFLNVFDYIAYSAQENDIIMIHGMDSLSLETAKYIKTTVQKVEKKGVRLAYLFDVIGKKENKNENDNLYDIEYSDIFNTQGVFYEDIENDFDFTILGVMTRSDLTNYEKLIGQKLPEGLSAVLTALDEKDQFQVRRKKDLASNFVYANFAL